MVMSQELELMVLLVYKYLRGENGKRLKQKIGNGQWKPISDANEVEPKDGYDVYTTIDVNIQDIAHHSFLVNLKNTKQNMVVWW